MSEQKPFPAGATAGFIGRRVVTGHDEHGKSVVLSDGPSPLVFSTPALPGYVSYDMFRTFENPVSIALQTAETTDGPRRQLPTQGGTVIRVSEVPPTHQSTKNMDASAAAQAFKALGNTAGHTGHASAKDSLMHRTETIDYVIVLSGELTLVLDEAEVVLRAGDVLVQCGTNHGWQNRTDVPATVMFVLISGAYQPQLSEVLAGAATAHAS